MEQNSVLSTLSKTISALFYPVLIPVYVMGIMMAQGLLLGHATPEARFYFLTVIVLNTVIVPGVCILLFNRIRFWRENPNSDFRERILPMLVMIICYSACLFMIRDVPFAYPVRKMLVAGLCCLALGFGVTFVWRISLHMIAQGAAVAFLAILMASGADGLLWILCAAVACAAIVATARLYLGKQSPAQILGGFLGGFAVTVLSIYLI